MLTIYFADDNIPDNIIDDVEEAFTKIGLDGSIEEKHILKEIEQAKYKNSTQFIDRFDNTLAKGYLSTGCKTALLVLRYPNKVVDTIECGRNAIAAIIENCTEGSIILHSDTEPIANKSNKPIEVAIGNKIFNSFNELNEYIDAR